MMNMNLFVYPVRRVFLSGEVELEAKMRLSRDRGRRIGGFRFVFGWGVIMYNTIHCHDLVTRIV